MINLQERILYFLSVVFLIFVFEAYAEYRSGFFQISLPNDSFILDFSELEDGDSTFDEDEMYLPDIRHTNGILHAYEGIIIIKYGIFDSAGLDSLSLVPDSGYNDTAQLDEGYIFIVQTRENRYAALHFVSIYIGARSYAIFKWAYQTLDTNDLTPDLSANIIRFQRDVHTFNQLDYLQESKIEKRIYNILGQYLGEYNYLNIRKCKLWSNGIFIVKSREYTKGYITVIVDKRD